MKWDGLDNSGVSENIRDPITLINIRLKAKFN